MAILNDISPVLRRERSREHSPSPRNRLMLFLIWLRSYPSLCFLSVMFDVSSSTVENELNSMRWVMWNAYARNVRWPPREEWEGLRGLWPKLPDAVGAIDDTSHRI